MARSPGHVVRTGQSRMAGLHRLHARAGAGRGFYARAASRGPGALARVRRAGEYRWMLERATPLYADGGLFLGYAGACVDIDAHKCMENGLARALERERRARIATEESSRLRHDLMVSVLEELRAPAEAI